MSICVISFSSRKGGNCEKISELICSLLPDTTKYSFCDFEIHPCGNCNYECFSKNSSCPFYNDMEYELLDAVSNSSQSLFILPNYCDYPCANFFIFNERSQCYFQHRADLLDKYEIVPKKAIVISNTNEENFKIALNYHCEGKLPALFLSAKKYGRKSIAGDLITSKEAVLEIKKFIL